MPQVTPASALVLVPALAVAAIGLAAAPAAGTQAPPASRTGRGWARPSVSLQQSPADLLDAAPHGQRVRVVSLRVADGHPRVSVTTATGRVDALAAVADAQAGTDTVSVAVDVPVHADATPSADTDRAAQWALDRLSAETVWAGDTGAGVTVAVVDSGVDRTHPDLAGRVLPGTDLVAPGGDGGIDGNGHGTHVAGIVAAVAGNGVGVAGLAPGAAILPVRVLDAAGAGWSSTTASGVIWAVDHGAQIVNLSLGSSTPNAVTQQAVDYATAHGVLVVAAAGNSRASGNAANYPAAYPGVLAVAATDQADASAYFSNTGAYVDVAAPGVAILSTVAGGGYAYMSGTSMATPYAAATAALVKAANPALTPGALITLLEQSATDLSTFGRDDLTGYGLVSPVNAVCRVTGCSGTPILPAPLPPAAVAPTLLSLTPVARTVRYGASVRGVARLVDAATGAAISAAPLRLCHRSVPAQAFSCTTLTTGPGGTAPYRLPARAKLAVRASFAGTSTAAATTSPTSTYDVVASAVLTTSRHRVVATVRPGRGQRVTLLQHRGHRWVAVAHQRVDARGQATFAAQTGARYRVKVASSATLRGVTSALVRVH